MADSPRFSVRFDGEAFAEDLHHATPAGREIAVRERGEGERADAGTEGLRLTTEEGYHWVPWPLR